MQIKQQIMGQEKQVSPRQPSSSSLSLVVVVRKALLVIQSEGFSSKVWYECHKGFGGPEHGDILNQSKLS